MSSEAGAFLRGSRAEPACRASRTLGKARVAKIGYSRWEGEEVAVLLVAMGSGFRLQSQGPDAPAAEDGFPRPTAGQLVQSPLSGSAMGMRRTRGRGRRKPGTPFLSPHVFRNGTRAKGVPRIFANTGAF